MPPFAAAGWQAVAAIDGGLAPDRLRELLADRDAGVRAVAVVWAVGTPEEAAARRLARSDPVPEVRAAAVRALLDERATDALEIGFDALFDADPSVRSQAAQSVARFGSEVVPRLRELALSRSGQATAGPMAALALTGPEGHDVLRELAHEHPDPDAQAMARLMLGRDPRHEH
jgi:HEAT repeat protein